MRLRHITFGLGLLAMFGAGLLLAAVRDAPEISAPVPEISGSPPGSGDSPPELFATCVPGSFPAEVAADRKELLEMASRQPVSALPQGCEVVFVPDGVMTLSEALALADSLGVRPLEARGVLHGKFQSMKVGLGLQGETDLDVHVADLLVSIERSLEENLDAIAGFAESPETISGYEGEPPQRGTDDGFLDESLESDQAAPREQSLTDARENSQAYLDALRNGRLEVVGLRFPPLPDTALSALGQRGGLFVVPPGAWLGIDDIASESGRAGK